MLKWMMASALALFTSAASAADPLKACTAIINGVGEIAPGDSCCIGFGGRKCTIRDMDYDTLYVGSSTKRDPALVSRLKTKADSLLSVKEQRDNSVRAAANQRNADSVDAIEKAERLALKKKKKWSKRVWAAIDSQKVFIGMTDEQARLSWGEPDDINRTINAAGTFEQWVYGSGSYLYFTNNKLTTIQN